MDRLSSWANVISDTSRQPLTMASEAVSETLDTADSLTEFQRKPVCLAEHAWQVWQAEFLYVVLLVNL